MSYIKNMVVGSSSLRPTLINITKKINSSSLINHRHFANTSSKLAPGDDKDSKARRDRKTAARLTQKKLAAKQPASTHDLYMEVPQALRYLRAAELGRPDKEASITVQTVVFGINGIAPLSGAIRFPHPVTSVRIGVATSSEEAKQQALASGASFVGDIDWINQVAEGKGKLDIDVLYATPEVENHLRKAARVLGPKKLMPSVKKGTISENIVDLIKGTVGSHPFRQRDSFVSLVVGRCSFTDEQIMQNLVAASKALRESVASVKSKKPITIGMTTLSSTHGPGIVINYYH